MENEKKESGGFLGKMKARMGIGSPDVNATDVYESGMSIVPECVSAKEGEVPVKQYNVAVLKNPFKCERAEARMQVTNKRVIFRAAGRSVGGRTTLQHEFDINEIGGVKANKNFRFSFFYLILALLIIDVTGSAINGRIPSIPRLLTLMPSEGTGSAILTVVDEFVTSNENRIDSLLIPSGAAGVSADDAAAIVPGNEPEELVAAMEAVQSAIEEEESAKSNVAAGGIMSTRRVATDDYDPNTWEQIYVNQSFRDTSASGLAAANEQLAAATAAREEAEELEAEIRERIEAGMANTGKSKGTPEQTWAILMIVLGVGLGLGGLIPFYTVFKKFGLKLFILNFSIFGWTLAIAASGASFIYVLLVVSIITMIFCIFLFCSKPNLAIVVKTKDGKVALNLCRDSFLTSQEEKGTMFRDVIAVDETETAIKEIGAIVSDIQKSPDSAVSKWKK